MIEGLTSVTVEEDARILLDQVQITDVDDSGEQLQVTLTVNNGTLSSVGGDHPYSYSPYDESTASDGVQTLTLSGTLSEINAQLSGDGSERDYNPWGGSWLHKPMWPVSDTSDFTTTDSDGNGVPDGGEPLLDTDGNQVVVDVVRTAYFTFGTGTDEDPLRYFHKRSQTILNVRKL